MNDQEKKEDSANDKSRCRHCGEKMSRWMPPEDASWNLVFQYVCFNDNCSYYVEGWKRMKDKYSHHCSYRFRYDPHTGQIGPLPVWSASALRGRILDQGKDE